MALSQIENTWTKKEAYELGEVISVYRIENPYLEGRYNTYKSTLSGEGVSNGGEVLVFHGCTETAMDLANPHSIIRTGFRKEYWRTSAGQWQRFGPGFYFAQQASKSHEYPLSDMRKLKRGQHIRRMLLCKVARGNVFGTAENMDHLQGAAPEGYDSVHGD